MFIRLLNGKSKSITSAAIIIGAASLVSRLLGVLRDRVLASEFGAGAELDTYYAAFRIPDLVFNLLVLGALSAGFIPVFSDYLKTRGRAWQLASVVVNVLLVGLLIVSALLIALAPWLMRLIAPGFSPAQLTLAAELTRIMLLSPILLGLSGIFGSILQSFQRFFAFAIAPIVYNIGIIFGALFLVPTLGIFGLAWGVVLGAALHLVVQFLPVLQLGYRHTLSFDLTTPGLRKMFSMMVPRTLSLAVMQINVLIFTVFASGLAAGSIAVFNFGNNLQSLPLGLFGVSFAAAAFPTLSHYAQNRQKFVEIFSLTVRQILFLVLPATGLLLVLRAQIVRVTLGAGLFSWEDTLLTLHTLSAFAISLFAQSLVLLLARAFYAQQDSRTPLYAGLCSAFASCILALMLIERHGVVGLALAYSLSNVLNLVLLWMALRYRLGSLDGRRISWAVSKMLVASGMLVLVAWAVKFLVEPQVILGTQTFLGVLAQLLAASAAGFIAYVAVCWLLRSEELAVFIAGLQRRFLRKVERPAELVDPD